MKSIKLDLDQKIYEILSEYKNKGAMLWKLDTNIMNSWNRFIKKFNKNFKSSNFNVSSFNIETKVINNTEKYCFLIDNINLTPKVDKKEYWSWGALYQFLRIGKIFGFFYFDKKELPNNTNNSYVLSPKITMLFDKNFLWHNLLLDSLKETLTSNIDYYKNFGVSLFVIMIFTYNKKILIDFNEKNYGKFCFISGKKEINFNGVEWETDAKKLCKTYKNSADILNNKIEDIIDGLYSCIEIDGKLVHEFEKPTMRPKDTIAKKNKNIDSLINVYEELDSYGSALTKTQSEVLVKSRIGQKKFKANLYKIYPKCILSDIDAPELLNASHIIPWIDCNNDDRLSCFNGFLMSPSIDKLFDWNLISFDENGFIYYSEKFLKKHPNNYKEILKKIGVKDDYLSNENRKSIFSNIPKKYHIKFKPYLLVHFNKTKNNL